MPNNRNLTIIFTSIFAFYPDNMAFNVITSPEIIFVTLLLLSYYLYLFQIKYRFILIGLVLGIATIIRPQAVLIPLLFLGLELYENRNYSKFINYFLLSYLGIFIIITPVIYRNYIIFEKFIFISNNGGINLQIAHNSNANGRYMETKYLDSLGKLNYNEYEKDQLAKKEAISFIKSHPFSIFQNFPKKIIGYFGYVSGFNWINEGLVVKMEKIIWIVLMGASNLYYWLILIMFLFTLYKNKLVFANKSSIHSFLVIFYFVLLHTIFFFGSPKYNQTIIPFVLLYSVLVIDHFYFQNGTLILKSRKKQILPYPIPD